MATLSADVPRAAPSPIRRRVRLLTLLHTLRVRIYLTLTLVILLTLTIAGIVFFFLLGGYQDRLAASTLRQVAQPVYESVITLADADFRAFEVSRQLQGSVGPDPDILILFVDAGGTVVGEASRNPRFRGQQLDLDLQAAGVGVQGFVEGTVRSSDGARLNYLASGLEADAAQRFSAAYVVLALPTENRQAVLGDLTVRLMLSGGLALVVALLAGLYLSRTIYRPLQATTAAVRTVARGRYDHKVELSGTVEARELAESFNQMTEEVQRQQAALRDFLANVSHDLQTPLTSIHGFSQALMDGTVDSSEARHNASRIIEEESRRLLRLVEGLLDLSRLEAGQADLHLSAVAVGPLLRHIGDLFSLRAQELDVRLVVEPVDVPDVWGDADRLEQILANLVDNALRHTPPGGEVRLHARRESESTIGLAVTDTGIGIAEEAIPHLFDRFYRSDRPGAQGGTGLGLAIARELALAQGGEVQVESREGEGATFRVLLRLHRPPAAANPSRGLR